MCACVYMYLCGFVLCFCCYCLSVCFPTLLILFYSRFFGLLLNLSICFLKRERKYEVRWMERWGGSWRRWEKENHDQYIFYEKIYFQFKKKIKESKGQTWASSWSLVTAQPLPNAVYSIPEKKEGRKEGRKEKRGGEGGRERGREWKKEGNNQANKQASKQVKLVENLKYLRESLSKKTEDKIHTPIQP